MRDPKERFSDRADAYARYRPGYPRAVLDVLVDRSGLGPGRIAADVGSGTGLLAALLLESGARVVGVEPNPAMREKAERAFAAEARFTSCAGCAEATGLPDASVDLVTAGQAFHWFDPEGARAEFTRISRPGAVVALVWNLRKDTPILRDYERLLEELAPDYANVSMEERASSPYVHAFYAPARPQVASFDHAQVFDEAGFYGRLASASYAPQPGSPEHEAISARLGEIFRRHARGGVVRFDYEARVYTGTLPPR